MVAPVTISELDLPALVGIVSDERADLSPQGLPLSLLSDLTDQVRCDVVSFVGLDTSRQTVSAGSPRLSGLGCYSFLRRVSPKRAARVSGSFPCAEGDGTRRAGGGTLAGSVWDEVLDTEHAVVVRTYIEQWTRKDRAPEKVLIIVVEPDEETRYRCPECGQRGRPVEHDVVRWRTLDVHGKRAFLESAAAADHLRRAREDHRGGALGAAR